MRPEPLVIHRGAFGSPHINRMEGDLTKISALGSSTSDRGISNKTEYRESPDAQVENSLGENETNNSSLHENLSGGQSSEHNTGRKHISTAHHAHLGVAQTLGSRSELPLQTGGSFDELHPSWSNIVSAGALSDQTNDIARRPSSDTLTTSNVSRLQFDSLNERSHSFPENDSLSDKPARYLASFSPGHANHSSRNTQQNTRGVSPLQPLPASYKDAITSQPLPTIQQGVEGPTTPLHSPMVYPNPNPHVFVPREFKPRPYPAVNYSPLSLGESTEQTSPMSSPSVSPHMTPLQLPKSRNHVGRPMSPGPPLTWHLSPRHNSINSDVNEFHSESPHHFHTHQTQGISEYRQGPANQAYTHHSYLAPFHHAVPNEQTYHSYMAPRQYNAIALQQPKFSHSTSPASHHQHSTQTRRPGSKLNPGQTSQASMSRSSTEILKTLLRKKACLYEPETSFAISLVTWLVGRRLALAQGYFTRQQLQSGVHSCVSSKIEDGIVTRTKVNRCMQIILNSCFHYIIPRPDGSEESGEAFRSAFLNEVTDDEQLLIALSSPWNDLSLVALEEDNNSTFHYGSDDDGDQPQAGKTRGKESSSSGHGAGESVDGGGKRAVLLCFNENVRSANDVFRCHNEFIRDVAHTANLNLSPEEWRSFFSGTKVYRKRSGSVENSAIKYFHSSVGNIMTDMYDRMDQQGLSKFRVSWCAKRYEHDHTLCAFAHVDVNRGWLRRDPFAHNYKPILCQHIKMIQGAGDCYFNLCPHGINCNHSHSKEEILYHPENYKRFSCKSHLSSCLLRDICPNIHTHKQPGSSSEISLHHNQGYNRQGKRYHGDHSPVHRGQSSTPKRRIVASGGHAGGFGKNPGGSPMLYIDPAPESEFEKTLFLPGLQAIFRDYSTSTFCANTSESQSYQYGTFGYQRIPRVSDTKMDNLPIGRTTGR